MQPYDPGVLTAPPSLPPFIAPTDACSRTQMHMQIIVFKKEKKKKHAQILVLGVTVVLCATVAFKTWLV